MTDGGFFSASVARSVKPRGLAVARCDLCKLYAAGCASPKLPRGGDNRRNMLVVVESPDHAADAGRDIRFDQSLAALERTLAAAGVDLWRDCAVTYAARCKPPKHLWQHPDAVPSCHPFVLKDVAETDPTVVLLVGEAAVKSVIPHLWGKDDAGPIGRWVGQVVPAHRPNAWVVPVYGRDDVRADPTGVFLDVEVRRAVSGAVKLLNRVPWPSGPPDYAAQVECVLDPAEAARRLGRYTSGLIAYDYETTCLKPDGDGRIVCASVCWEGVETIAFPWHGAVIPAMQKLLADPAVGKIMQNATMEIRWTRRKLGVAPANVVFDTMLAAHAISPREKQKERGGGVTGLKFLAFARLGQPEYNSHLDDFLKGGKGGYAQNRIGDIDPVQLLTYCGMDSLLDFKLAEILSVELGVAIG